MNEGYMLENKKYEIKQGDCLEVLKTLPDESVYTCVTSPPYYALRDYGTGEWIGGDPNCKHMKPISDTASTGTHAKMREMGITCASGIYKSVCPDCGAIRVDKQVGLEETPEEYIERLVAIFKEVKRVLKDDGTLWINIGDSYWNSGSHDNIKQKDLIGIPWMLAFALRKDGWYLRQDIIWHKPNPMPESVRDRCTKSHEYIFLLSKSSTYYFDNESIKEDANPEGAKRYNYPIMVGDKEQNGVVRPGSKPNTGGLKEWTGKRNKRDVWDVNVNSTSIAHFATYPEKLIKPCILSGCPKGEIVLDPFSGTATTGMCAIHNDRKYLGIELNTEYAELSESRLGEEVAKESLW